MRRSFPCRVGTRPLPARPAKRRASRWRAPAVSQLPCATKPSEELVPRLAAQPRVPIEADRTYLGPVPDRLLDDVHASYAKSSAQLDDADPLVHKLPRDLRRLLIAGAAIACRSIVGVLTMPRCTDESVSGARKTNAALFIEIPPRGAGAPTSSDTASGPWPQFLAWIARPK